MSKDDNSRFNTPTSNRPFKISQEEFNNFLLVKWNETAEAVQQAADRLLSKDRTSRSEKNYNLGSFFPNVLTQEIVSYNFKEKPTAPKSKKRLKTPLREKDTCCIIL